MSASCMSSWCARGGGEGAGGRVEGRLTREWGRRGRGAGWWRSGAARVGLSKAGELVAVVAGRPKRAGEVRRTRRAGLGKLSIAKSGSCALGAAHGRRERDAPWSTACVVCCKASRRAARGERRERDELRVARRRRRLRGGEGRARSQLLCRRLDWFHRAIESVNEDARGA